MDLAFPFIKVHYLKFYIIILTIFILDYGVPTYSLIYGVQQFSWHMPRAIINLAYIGKSLENYKYSIKLKVNETFILY
jgi:hypothetical protein